MKEIIQIYQVCVGKICNIFITFLSPGGRTRRRRISDRALLLVEYTACSICCFLGFQICLWRYISLFDLLDRLKIIILLQFYIVSGVLGLETQASNLCSAITAVVVLHVMLGLYIFRTFYPVKKQTKQD